LLQKQQNTSSYHQLFPLVELQKNKMMSEEKPLSKGEEMSRAQHSSSDNQNNNM